MTRLAAQKQHGNKGKKLSEEHKQKMSDAHKGHPVSKETKRKISATRKGRKSPNKGKPGKKHTEETQRKLSEANKGKNHPSYGKARSEETKQKISEAQKGRKSPNKGKPISEETKQRQSATKQGIPYDEWEKFAKEKLYCPKFNEACKESNREKYGRRCFICNKTERANGQKLSVHHVDMDKAQGCESNWKLVPLCKRHHATSHNEELIARLGYLIKEK